MWRRCRVCLVCGGALAVFEMGEEALSLRVWEVSESLGVAKLCGALP